jgi:hypothetical protein
VVLEDSPERKKKLIIIAASILVVAAGVTWYMLHGKSPAQIASERVFIDSETGQMFEHTIKEGEEEPIKSPYTGKNTGYEPEACYWVKTPEGKYKAKLTPTYVLLKSRVNPKSKEKTYCPDCGKEVKAHNPLPSQKLMKEAEDAAKQK